MLNAIALKLLWPFLNEAILKNKPLLEFIKLNKLVLILLLLNAFTAFSCFYLFRLVQTFDVRETENENLIERLSAAVKNQGRNIISLNENIAFLNANIKICSVNLSMAESKIDKYEIWLNSCGVKLDGDINQAIRCNVPIPTRPPSKASSRVRNIFNEDMP